MNEMLKEKIRAVAQRQERLEFWCALTRSWAAAALAGIALVALQNRMGWASWVSLPLIILVALFLLVFLVPARPQQNMDWRALSRHIETQFPELDGRLLTAVQQHAADGNGLNYLQERLIADVLRHCDQSDWTRTISHQRLKLAHAAHAIAVILFGLVLFQLRVPMDRGIFVRNYDPAITVTPGDATVERGSSLVVLARFSGPLPSSVDMVVDGSAQVVRTPLVKSLADAMFGRTVPEVDSNFTYHVSYDGRATREFQVNVFEYPRLQKADVDVSYPAYTGEPRRHVPDTRRLSAVEGSSLDLTLQFNKPVTSARLVSRNKERRVISLEIETNRPVAILKEFALDSTQTYDLQLLDADGRTNKLPAQFVLEALKNRPPEIRLTTPRGDLRPSALEEISFEGSVWDDFGVTRYGLGYSVAGRPTEVVPLGEKVPGKQKLQFRHVLRLEDLQVKPDELVSWFVWADDLGPDGNVRRTVGDLFFGEIRPFDEVFREGQGMEGQGQSQGEQSGEGNQTARLTELQKQIISATWNLQRSKERASKPGPNSPHSAPLSPHPESRTSPVPSSVPRLLAGIVDPSILAHSPVSKMMAQAAATESSTPGSARPEATTPSRVRRGAGSSEEDISVVRDSQVQAIEQATAAAERARDPRNEPLWTAALREMEKALDHLQRSTNSPAALTEALAAEQAAYQALLRLQEHEYQVSRQRNRGQSGSARQQQMERQLDQMDLTQSENRYENQRQAQAPQNSQRREQLQIMNRLQELARRQNDLNERLKELQSALQEARTAEERAELQRRLKRLQEEEQQMLADVDEVRQRMDPPENQSRMADERRQLDQTREDVQRAADAANQGSASQALASGTRAERQLQQTRDQLRKENSSQFADDVRSMRTQARELAQREQEIQKGMRQDDSEHKSLSDESNSKTLLSQLDRQKELLTNLVDRATQISQQAESSEPLLSSALYDSVRKFTQDSAKDVRELQDDLLNRGLMPGNLMDQLKSDSETEGAKLLDVTSEMLKRDFMTQASQAGQRAGQRMEDLKRGVERAAESVLGDDTEALRLAQQELDQLTSQLQNEIAQANPGESQTNSASAPREGASGASVAGGQSSENEPQTQAQSGEGNGSPSGQATRGNRPEDANSPGQTASAQAGQRADGAGNSPGSSEGGQNPPGSLGQRSGPNRLGNARQSPNQRAGGSRADGGNWADAASGGGVGGGGSWNVDRFLNDQAWRRSGPITGEDFLPWSDRLREVEEMVEAPDLRNEVAAARERARMLRQEFKEKRKKPDWAVVRTQVMSPLAQVRQRIADELARRQSNEALVPIDRDPVPGRYSELVRRYYEELGKDK